VADVLTHIVLHSSYHRGKIASLVGRAGESAAYSDYIECVSGISSASFQGVLKSLGHGWRFDMAGLYRSRNAATSKNRPLLYRGRG
jgi:hypothetical protein